jgi:glyceraldehyde 3-phosphate dehydrogenase
MKIKVAINGFGRIGRLVFRLMEKEEDIEITAINDLTSTKTLAHLLKYDTTQGRYEKWDKVSFTEKELIVGDKKTAVYAEKNPEDLPWKELGIDVVIESTGLFTSEEKAEGHIKAGAKKVIISAPATGEMKTVVLNVNHDILDGSEKIISAASCTTNALALMAKVLNDNIGIAEGLMTTLHAYTNDQNTLDSPHKKGDLRRARAAAANIVPTSTGAAKAIGKVIPELEGRLDGVSQRVPVVAGSLIELVAVPKKNTSVEEINNMMKKAANNSLGYTEDEIVSSDIIGMEYGSLFDATQTKVLTVDGKQLIKAVAWYDNEMSYVAQLVKLVKFFTKI